MKSAQDLPQSWAPEKRAKYIDQYYQRFILKNVAAATGKFRNQIIEALGLKEVK